MSRCASHLLRRSAGVHACPSLFVGVVTQLDTHAGSRHRLRSIDLSALQGLPKRYAESHRGDPSGAYFRRCAWPEPWTTTAARMKGQPRPKHDAEGLPAGGVSVAWNSEILTSINHGGSATRARLLMLVLPAAFERRSARKAHEVTLVVAHPIAAHVRRVRVVACWYHRFVSSLHLGPGWAQLRARESSTAAQRCSCPRSLMSALDVRIASHEVV